MIAVENGRQALDATFKNAIDMAFLGYTMAEMDGLETTMPIRVTSEKKIPIFIILNPEEQTEDTQLTCTKAGVNDMLLKPFNPDELVSLLSEWGG